MLGGRGGGAATLEVFYRAVWPTDICGATSTRHGFRPTEPSAKRVVHEAIQHTNICQRTAPDFLLEEGIVYRMKQVDLAAPKNAVNDETRQNRLYAAPDLLYWVVLL